MGAGVSTSMSTLVLNLGWKVRKPFNAALSITVRPAPAVRNVGAVIFWKCFHYVNYLWDAPRKKGLELGKRWNWVSLVQYARLGKHYPIFSDRIMGFHSTDIGNGQIYLFLSKYRKHMTLHTEHHPREISLETKPLLWYKTYLYFFS